MGFYTGKDSPCPLQILLRDDLESTHVGIDRILIHADDSLELRMLLLEVVTEDRCAAAGEEDVVHIIQRSDGGVHLVKRLVEHLCDGGPVFGERNFLPLYGEGWKILADRAIDAV
ncbi:hypothetical protein GHT07_18505 [Caenimonas koreensis DSM 17982]|uniref:Uncharacterized protein n=1 Tax=Caenimonas koreensis DSM 17982 TaxID=1121255 RepID=A0A844BFN5_9BURK|nr:hypothetical protein [Caenimonas koreensis]MRD49271.1 hypothetical protein [Caenimonas koreensis DSM 17982]